jgi:beta-lactam-binding protein with PASTA domain
VIVPNVIGLSRVGASNALRAAGLVPGTVSSAVDPTCNNVGAVMRQHPGAGSLLAPGSPVNLVIGARPRTCP